MESIEANRAESLQELAASIRDENKRLHAWEKAAEIGPAAIPPLIALMADPDFEVVRAAKRGLWKIVRAAGKPESPERCKAVVGELLAALQPGSPAEAKREIVWMLSEIGREDCVPRIAPLLNDEAVRDDARMALERIPGEASIKALRESLSQVPEPFKFAIAHSLRVRGIDLKEYPSQKLIPRNDYILKSK